MSFRKLFAAAAASLALLLLSACGAREAPPPEETAPPAAETAAPTPTPEPDWSFEAGQLRFSELMLKNRAVLFDADGAAPDWIELENLTDGPVSLAGWQLSDRAGRGWTLPERTLGAGERLVIFASGKDRRDGELHTDFSLSAGETLSLTSPHGLTADSVLLPETEADCSLIRGMDGAWAATVWPSPGFENGKAGYDLYQSTLAAEGPLVISEVMVANFLGTYAERAGYGDWVEIKNVSGESVELSDYYLSDDADDYFAFSLPARTLAPGAYTLVKCGDDTDDELPLSLSSERERLYLSSRERLLDAVSLHDVPLDGSVGRIDGENGFFYFASATPGRANGQGYRRVSDAPVFLTPGGCFDGVESVTVNLSAADGGVIRYTLDGTVPSGRSALYEGGVTLTKTGILRASATEPGCLPSRAVTESYFLNEEHELPVLSLVLDDLSTFQSIYRNKIKHYEMPGSVAFYEEGGSFSLGCGVTLSGATSLDLPKKNLSVRFRGAYGDEWLDYDLFGGGVTRFQSLTIRSGQDYYYSIIRNELCQDIALEFSEHLVVQRSRFCVLYVNGQYYGLYALKEKVTRQLYASTFGYSKESVIMEEASVKPRDAFYQEVYAFVTGSDMSDPANYERFCQIADVDSLVDWAVLEGYFANNDILSGNVRFVKSSEGDGKWRLVFYDLDAALHRRELSFSNLYGSDRMAQQISQILRALLKNADFKTRLLERTVEGMRGPLASAHVLARADEMLAQIETERLRDFRYWHTSELRFQNETAHMLAFLTDYDGYALHALSRCIHLSAEERSLWFSDWLG